MLKKLITAFTAATVLSVAVLAIMPASANPRTNQPTHTIMNPNDVWVGNELAGRDSDANVRLELRHTFGVI
jgi:hypothetical protein